MAWITTVDEKSVGQDAPFAFSTAFHLAEGESSAAFGLLNPVSNAADGDLFGLGTLFRGTYFIRAASSDWYPGPGTFSAITPRVALYSSSSGTPLRSGDGGFAFLLNEPGSVEQGNFFVGVIGSAVAASQYRLWYEWLRPERGLGRLALVGDPIVGNTLASGGWLVDPDGVTSAYRVYRWLADGQSVGSASTLQISESLAGRSLVLEVDYVDDDGYLTTLSSDAVPIAAAVSASPTVQITTAVLDLGRSPFALLNFQLSAEATDFTASDVNVTGGLIRDFTGSGRQYMARIVPDAGRIAEAKVSVPSGAFSNALGQFNQDGMSFDNSVTLRYDSSAPRLQWPDGLRVDQSPVVTFETSAGAFSVEIDASHAPLTASNVLTYVQDGFYDGLVFHRSIPGFMVQGGGFGPGGRYASPTYDPVPLEADNGLPNVRGSVAMARTSDPDSATSQFFVNFVNNDFLNQTQDGSGSQPANGFGRVVSGMETIDAMAAIPTGALRPLGSEGQALNDYPTQDITIIRAQQTTSGLAVSEEAGIVLEVLDSDPASAWSYSLDGGIDWTPGLGSSLHVPEGHYPLGSIQVRYDASPGVPALDANVLPLDLIVDDPATGRMSVHVYHWRSHRLLGGVQLTTAWEQAVSSIEAAVSLRGGSGPMAEVSATIPQQETSLIRAARDAVGLNDAISVLRMAVGREDLVSGRTGLSPYQRISADLDGDGTVSMQDALGTLRLASAAHSSLTAPEHLWRLVDEQTVLPHVETRLSASDASIARLSIDPSASVHASCGFVLTVAGDVDGSFPGDHLSNQLDRAYFESLISRVEGLDLARFGILE